MLRYWMRNNLTTIDISVSIKILLSEKTNHDLCGHGFVFIKQKTLLSLDVVEINTKNEMSSKKFFSGLTNEPFFNLYMSSLS